MHEQRMRDVNDAVEDRLTRALERVPEVTIPTGFAARVAAQVPKRREMAARPARYGWMAMRISMAVLVIALVAVAMHMGQRSSVFGITMEWMLCAELVGLAVWLGGVRGLIVPKA
jgi:uncharacterized membrane protein